MYLQENTANKSEETNQTKDTYLYIFLLIFIGIVFVLFLLSTIIVYTTWLDLQSVELFLVHIRLNGHISDIWLLTTLILIAFLIAQARYSIKLNGESKTKKLQLQIGFIFAFYLVSKVLIFYYESVYSEKLLHQLNFNKTLGAKRTVIDAQTIFFLHGVTSKYFEINGSIKLYKPKPDVIKVRQSLELMEEKKHLVPIYLVIIFIALISSNILGIKLAEIKIKKHLN